MNERTIQDIDVDHAEEVDMDVVINTCNQFARLIRRNDERQLLLATAKEFGFEL
jgi:DNA primase catalytic subunit